MIEIKPFRAFIYNKKKIKSVKNVVAPPYDIISAKQQNSYYRRSKYNIIRLILAKTYSSDTKDHNRYTRSAELLKRWQRDNILIQDKKPSIYVYKQTYYDREMNEKVNRTGFICLFRLQDFNKGNIYPHEHTLPKPKKDRLRLLKKTKANFSPVFCLFSDQKGKVDKILNRALSKNPFMQVTDDNKTKHALYRISNPQEIKEIQKLFLRKKIFIADGHHRYETALKFRPNGYTMMYFTNLNNKGLRIYPIHRLIRDVQKGTSKNFINNLNTFFHIKKLKEKKSIVNRLISSRPSDYIYGMYFNKVFYLLFLKDKGVIRNLPTGRNISYIDKLKVSLLHRLVIKRILKAPENKITYIDDTDELIHQVDKRKNRIGLFMPAIKANEIIKVALKKQRLPRKSTYFYPKLYSGLVINKIDTP